MQVYGLVDVIREGGWHKFYVIGRILSVLERNNNTDQALIKWWKGTNSIVVVVCA